ncbi:MAG TPA: PAS domain S-box protein, partial [Cyanophyceae cyanobacterium]
QVSDNHSHPISRFEVTQRFRHKDGSTVYILSRVTQVKDESGQVIRMVGTHTDISDVTRTTEALQQSRSLLAGVLNSSLDGVAAFEAIRDAQGEIIDFKCLLLNPAAEKMLGRRANKLVGKQLLIELPRLRQNSIIEQFIGVVNTGDTLETALDYTSETRTIWLQLVAVKLGDGLTVTFRDITQRKQAEEALRESEARFRGIFENAAIAIGISKADGTLIAVNPTYETFLGYSEAEMLGRTFAEITHPDDIKPEQLLTQSVINGTQDSFQMEKRYLHKDGEVFWARLTVSAVRHPDGTFLFNVAMIEDINDSKLREIILRESERRFRAIFNNSFQMTTLLKPNGIVIEANQTALDFGGIKRTDVAGRLFWETGWWQEDDGNRSEGSALNSTSQLHPKQEQLKQAIQRAALSQFVRYEVEIRGFGNLRATIDFSLKPVTDETGNVVLLIAEGRDISERKRVEEELKKSEERWQLALQGNNDGIWDWNIKTNTTFRSSRWLEILGYQDDELGNDNGEWINRLHPDDVERVTQVKQDYLTRKIPNYRVEYRLRCKDGRYKWVLGRGQAVWDEAGNPIRMVGSNTDISDAYRQAEQRKQAELEITLAKIALEQQIQRVLLQKRITQEIRSSLNPQHIFQTAANQIGEAFAVSRCLIHTYIHRPIPQIPCVAEYKQPEFESIMSSKIPVIGNLHAQTILSQDAAVISDDIYTDPLLTQLLPLCQQLGLKSMLAVRTSYQGQPNGVICIHQYDRFRQWTPDEIELLESVAAQLGIAIAQANLLQQEKQRRRELAAQNHTLEKAKLEAEAANRAKSQFLSKMSHELRTPLNAILGFSQVMAHDDFLTTQQLDYLDIINRSGEHLLGLINDILSMSKIEAGQVTLNENCFNLYDLLNELEQMLQIKVNSKGLTLIFEHSPDLPPYIKTDESKLRQVLINLLGNAIKFTQTGSVTLRASRDEKTLRSQQWKIRDNRLSASQPITLRFEVEDTGFGIAPDELSTLFEPFVQTQSGRHSTEGTGLGLPISQQFIRMMGGEITVSSIVGQGSIFTFDIQVDLATSAEQQPQS